jgi:hypothetical protein
VDSRTRSCAARPDGSLPARRPGRPHHPVGSAHDAAARRALPRRPLGPARFGPVVSLGSGPRVDDAGPLDDGRSRARGRASRASPRPGPDPPGSLLGNDLGGCSRWSAPPIGSTRTPGSVRWSVNPEARGRPTDCSSRRRDARAGPATWKRSNGSVRLRTRRGTGTAPTAGGSRDSAASSTAARRRDVRFARSSTSRSTPRAMPCDSLEAMRSRSDSCSRRSTAWTWAQPYRRGGYRSRGWPASATWRSLPRGRASTSAVSGRLGRRGVRSNGRRTTRPGQPAA